MVLESNPGNTLARLMFARIIADAPKVDRLQAIALVAKALRRSPLDIGLDVGLSNIHRVSNVHRKSS